MRGSHVQLHRGSHVLLPAAPHASQGDLPSPPRSAVLSPPVPDSLESFGLLIGNRRADVDLAGLRKGKNDPGLHVGPLCGGKGGQGKHWDCGCLDGRPSIMSITWGAVSGAV